MTRIVSRPLRQQLFAAFTSLVLATQSVRSTAEDPSGLIVPEGFRVDHFADDDLCHDVHSLTIDTRGRVVVSGPGYIRILTDADQDGRAEGYQTFADLPESGAQGMFWHENSLLCSGDQGILLFRDDNRDDRADGPPEVVVRIAAGGEHHVHAIQRGPDGWWYFIAGNFSEVTGAYAASATSPVRNPVSGTLHRMRPDLSGAEIVCDGIRNAYDFAFHPSGDCFTWDSDDERDITLPWYLPTQVLQLQPASNSGYVTPGWKRPPDFPDMTPVLTQFGRGSPTGVICYQHRMFPEHYRNSLFMLDWTLGRILCVTLTPDGHGGWNGEPQQFASAAGQFGFAPTDMEVAPDGSLFVSVGGRGTRGSVFRITHDAGSAAVQWPDASASPEERLKAVLTAPQPQASWSRALWKPLARRINASAFRDEALNEARPVAERLRAIECLVEMHPELIPSVAAQLTKAGSPRVRAHAAWALGRVRPDQPAAVLSEFAADKDPFVRRVSLEALTSITTSAAWTAFQPAIAAGLNATERPVRRTAALVVSRLPPAMRNALRTAVSGKPVGTVWFDIGVQMRSNAISIPAARAATAVLVDPLSAPQDRRDALRGLQLALGDVGPARNRPPMFDGYAPRESLESRERELNPLLTQVTSVFPSGDPGLDHELIRFFAMTASLNRDVFSTLLTRMTADSHPSDDIHILAALSRMPLERSFEESTRTAAALVAIDVKVRARNLKQDTNWDDRIGELYTALVTVDPAMPSVIVDQPGFGLPGHVLFLSQVPADVLPRAIDGFVRAIAADPEYPWSNDVVFVIGESDRPEHEQLLRQQLDNPAVRDAVLMVLAENPKKEDRLLFLSGLDSPQLNAVEACVNALTKLPRSNDAAEQFLLLSAARRLVNDTREYTIRETVMRLLQNNTGQAIPFQFGTAGHKPQPESLQAWQSMLQQRYPDYKIVTASEAADAILAGLDQVPWSQGDAERGRKLFDRLSCARCHGGRRSLGPDLTGVARRFSRDDLFAAIVDPNRDISSRYQTTAIETTAGTVLTGLIVYESVDGLLLRDAEHRTYRLNEADIQSRHQQRNSLMPGGLLKDATPVDLADLYRYLQSL